MNKPPTPRTDAAECEFQKVHGLTGFGLAKESRQLERELSEAHLQIEVIERGKYGKQFYVSQCLQLEQELKQLRKEQFTINIVENGQTKSAEVYIMSRPEQTNA